MTWKDFTAAVEQKLTDAHVDLDRTAIEFLYIDIVMPLESVNPTLDISVKTDKLPRQASVEVYL